MKNNPPLSFRLEWLDAAFAGGLQEGTLTYLLGNPGSEHSQIAAQFLLARLNTEKKCLWVGVHSDPPSLPGSLKDTWDAAIADDILHVEEIDLTLYSEQAFLDFLQSILEREQYGRVVIHHIDLLDAYEGKLFWLQLVNVLRKRKMTLLLTGTLTQMGKEIILEPAGLVKIVDGIVLARLMLESAETHCQLKMVKSSDSLPAPLTAAYRITLDGLLPLEPVNTAQDQGITESTRKELPLYSLVMENSYLNSEHKRMVQHRINEVNQCIQDVEFRLCKEGNSSAQRPDIWAREIFHAQRKEHFFPVDVTLLREYIHHDLIYPLNDFFTDEWKDQYLVPAFQQCIQDGQIWGIPHLIDVGVLIYRSDILEKYQFEPPRTWQELKDYTDYMLKRENNPNLKGFGFQGASSESLTCNYLEFLWNHGGDIFDASHQIILNSPQGMEALRCMENFIHSWKLAPSLIPDMTDEQSARYFLNEKLIFARHWLSTVSYASANYPSMKDKIKVAPLPTLEPSMQPQSVLGGVCYVIPRSAKNPERLIRFYRQFFTPDAIVEFAIKGWGCPAFKSVYSNSDVLNYRPYYRDVPELLKYGRSRAGIVYYPQLTKLIQSEVNLALRKIKTPQEALERVAEEFSKGIYHRIHSQRLLPALEYIHEHIAEELSRPQVASQCNLSPSYFGSLFKEVTGMNYSDYIKLKRVEKAKILLETSNLNSAEISQEVGFSDQSYFCQVFKKLTQMTPTQYRMNMLSKNV